MPVAGTNTVHGKIGGVEWTPRSGTGRAGKGYVHGQIDAPAIDLVFGDELDLCAGVARDQFRPSATYAAFHGIRAAIGTDKVSDAEIFTTLATCNYETRLDRESSEVIASNGSDVSVTITRLDADRIEGTIKATFEDLSTFEGSFSVSPCAGSGGFGDSPTCAAD